ncbi:MAG: hypothetical protein WA211_14075 [Candidatus Acidiferrales bacterium]
MGEIITLEQNRFAHYFGQGVSEAIAKIQTGGMPAFPIFAPRNPYNFDLFGIRWDHLDLCVMQEKIELATRRFAAPCFQHNARFQGVDRRDAPRFGLGYCL